MNQYHNFKIPIIQSDQPTGWEAINQGVIGSFNTLGQFAMQRRKKEQEMADAIQMMKIKAAFENAQAKERWANIQGMFGGQGGQMGIGEGMGQPMPPSFVNPQGAETQPMKSMAGGGVGDIEGNQLTPMNIFQSSTQPQGDIQPFITKPTFAFDEMGNPRVSFGSVENPYFRQKMDIEKNRLIENQKPYSADEIKVASQKSLIPQIDKLIELYKTKKVYEGLRVPFGASRISAFGEQGPWQTFKRGMTAGPGREAGLLLQNIKQLMFGPGGASLTEGERAVLGGMLNPAYKTEKKAIEDLNTAKRMIEEKFRMLRANPNEAFNQQPQNVDTNLDSQVNSFLDQIGAE